MLRSLFFILICEYLAGMERIVCADFDEILLNDVLGINRKDGEASVIVG